MNYKLIKNKILIWNKYNGHCAYCGCKLSISKTHIDHIIPQSCNWSNDFENLNPSCFNCNNYKSSWFIEEYRYYLKQLFTNLEYLFKSKVKMKESINFGVIEIKEWDGLFYFEKYKMF